MVTALRYNIHPPLRPFNEAIWGIRRNSIMPPPMRIFVIGARAESSLPREAWLQIAAMFHPVQFQIFLIGPEAMTNRDDEFPLPERTPSNPFGAIHEICNQWMKLSTYVDYYHTLHEAQHFHPFDPYFDCFVLFHPGLGHPSSSHEWASTVPQLLETKCPIICTGYTEWDMWRDMNWVQEQVGGEMDVLIEPGENRFRSLRWDINDVDPHDVSAANWGVWSFRGKMYEAQKTEE
jgi:splicing suppressor protein 51